MCIRVRLAGAGGAHHGDELAGLDRQGDAVEGGAPRCRRRRSGGRGRGPRPRGGPVRGGVRRRRDVRVWRVMGASSKGVGRCGDAPAARRPRHRPRSESRRGPRGWSWGRPGSAPRRPGVIPADDADRPRGRRRRRRRRVPSRHADPPHHRAATGCDAMIVAVCVLGAIVEIWVNDDGRGLERPASSCSPRCGRLPLLARRRVPGRCAPTRVFVAVIVQAVIWPHSVPYSVLHVRAASWCWRPACTASTSTTDACAGSPARRMAIVAVVGGRARPGGQLDGPHLADRRRSASRGWWATSSTPTPPRTAELRERAERLEREREAEARAAVAEERTRDRPRDARRGGAQPQRHGRPGGGGRGDAVARPRAGPPAARRRSRRPGARR